jgi:hypothetical protein
VSPTRGDVLLRKEDAVKSHLLSGLMVVTIASAAFADLVIEPDDYPAGMDLSHVFPGVTLSTVNSDPGNPAVFSLVPTMPYYASTGARVFGHAGDYPVHWVMETVSPFRYGALRADFSVPTPFVTLDFIGNDPSDYGQLTAYDAQGALLASVQTAQLTAGAVETLTVADIGEISYVVAGGLLTSTVCLDHMVIPEPTSLVLVVAVGICVARRRVG